MYRQRVGDYYVGRTIGEGSFAKVKYGQHVESGETVAIKVGCRSGHRVEFVVNPTLWYLFATGRRIACKGPSSKVGMSSSTAAGAGQGDGGESEIGAADQEGNSHHAAAAAPQLGSAAARHGH